MEELPVDLLETLFSEKGFSPNQSQHEAILHTDGPLFLTAGPGSGKTRVLLWRTLNLIVKHNVKPEEIFLATFTEKAALQLKQGLQGLLSLASQYTHKPYDISGMYVGTLHSLCQKLMSDGRFASTNGEHHKPAIMDELDQYFFISNSKNWEQILKAGGFNLENDEDFLAAHQKINEWFGRFSGSKMNAITNCISFFNRMSEEDFNTHELALEGFQDDYRAMYDDDMCPILFKMCVKYRELLAQADVERVDFSSLQQTALNVILAAPDYGNIFKHVIVDEYQDTNTIQQKIYMALASGTKNICVVGDDDQALYRFRGATVENLIDFENICNFYLGVRPKRIDLNINYRSRQQIVQTYVDFIENFDWSDVNNPGLDYRIADKNIQAFSDDERDSVLLATGPKVSVVEEIVNFVVKLKEEGKISDYNQCAFLFPVLRGSSDGMSAPVKAFADCFKERNIPFYAPRAKNFLYSDECLVTFGLFALIFNCMPTPEIEIGGMQKFHEWLEEALAVVGEILDTDKDLDQFIQSKSKEIECTLDDYVKLQGYCVFNYINEDKETDVDVIPELLKCEGLSARTREVLQGDSLYNHIHRRFLEERPVTVSYILARATALKWTLLDLFYELQQFKWYSEEFDMAENGYDGGLYNMGLISQYITRYMESHSPILSGRSFVDETLIRSFFFGFLYTIFRRGEGEFEDGENPFPKGAIPFLTVHQSKGLEFPVVVLGSIAHRHKPPRQMDVIVRNILELKGGIDGLNEPLEYMDDFDTMRMFYVALSRAKNLLVLSQFTGSGQNTYPAFTNLFQNNTFERPCSYDLDNLPAAKESSDDMAKVYSYAGDYLSYKRCPRSYMAFNKYGFVPSRSQSIFYSTLVRRTIEDYLNVLAQDNKEVKN